MNPLDAKQFRPVEGGASCPLSHRLYRMAWAVLFKYAAPSGAYAGNPVTRIKTRVLQ